MSILTHQLEDACLAGIRPSLTKLCKDALHALKIVKIADLGSILISLILAMKIASLAGMELSTMQLMENVESIVIRPPSLIIKFWIA